MKTRHKLAVVIGLAGLLFIVAGLFVPQQATVSARISITIDTCPTQPAEAANLFGGKVASSQEDSGWKLSGGFTLSTMLEYQSETPVSFWIPRDGIVEELPYVHTLYMVGILYSGRHFFFRCVADPGTSFTYQPPMRCPSSIQEAEEQFGGYDQEWFPPHFGTFPPLVFFGIQPLTFTVPRQGLVVSNGKEYTPGREVREAYAFSITCFPGLYYTN